VRNGACVGPHSSGTAFSHTTPPPPKLGQPVAARVWSARVGTRPTCSAYPGPAPPPTCHLGGVDLLTNKATRERTGGRATLKMTRGAKCGLSCDWQESGEDPKLSTFSIHSVACDKDLIFFFMPQRPPNHVGQYRCVGILREDFRSMRSRPPQGVSHTGYRYYTQQCNSRRIHRRVSTASIFQAHTSKRRESEHHHRARVDSIPSRVQEARAVGQSACNHYIILQTQCCWCTTLPTSRYRYQWHYRPGTQLWATQEHARKHAATHTVVLVLWQIKVHNSNLTQLGPKYGKQHRSG
jgi:hypothetical protein